MKLLALILAVASLPLAYFAWWGTSTVAGRAKYDEMDGLIPMGAGLLAIVLIIASVVLATVARHRKMRKLGQEKGGFPVVQRRD